MRRRQFLAGFGGVAGLPLAAWAQQGRTRWVSVLMAFDEYDSEGKTYLSEFTQGLAKLGWIDGSNLRVDIRWGAGNVDRMRLSAKELLDPRPDVILAHGDPSDRCIPTRDADDPDRICVRVRPSRRGLRCKPASPGWKYHRLHQPRSHSGE